MGTLQLQAQWLRESDQAGPLQAEIGAESQRVCAFIIDREVEAPERFQVGPGLAWILGGYSHSGRLCISWAGNPTGNPTGKPTGCLRIHWVPLGSAWLGVVSGLGPAG